MSAQVVDDSVSDTQDIYALTHMLGRTSPHAPGMVYAAIELNVINSQTRTCTDLQSHEPSKGEASEALRATLL